jgi:hypothetical protein
MFPAVHPLARRFGPALAFDSLEEQKDALDNLRGSAGVVAVGDGDLLYRRRAAAPAVGFCLGGNGDTPGSGAEGCRLRQQVAARHTGEYTNMPLLNIVFVLIVVGVALWAINRYIPMASSIKTLLNIVVVVCTSVWLLQVFGLWGQITSYKLH